MRRELHLSKILITNHSKPVFNSGLLIENSRIIRIGKKEDFGNLDNTNIEIINHGEALICPGFINLHTHLLYSNMDQINGQNGLFPWLEDLVDKTSNWSDEDYKKSINFGISECLQTGTTFVVENTPSALSAQELLKSPLKALIGLEVFGSDEEKADEIFNSNLNLILPLTSHLSPHAPYDVSLPLWKKLVDWAKKNDAFLFTHLEESPDEKLWWQKKSGTGINFWKKINKLEPKLKYWKKYDSGIDFLKKNKLLNKNIIATHLCQATNEDLQILKNSEVKLVHCPRSNFYLNNGAANLKIWNEFGFLWGIGTDSIASNKNLDLLEEVRFAINQQSTIYRYKISAREAFYAITLNGAKILSKEDEIGVLKRGAFADFLVYDIKDKSACTYNDPYHLLIWDIDNKKDLKEVWISGKKAWKQEHMLHKI